MANISLTKCNIIENNCCKDNEILYPLTVTDQVILDNGKTLTEWIEQLNLNPSISVESYYEYPIAKVGNTEIGIPVWDGVNQIGIVLPHSDYFGLEGGQMKPKRTYSPAFDSSITIGTVQGDNGASLYDVKMPSFNLDTLVDGSTVTLQLKAGNTIFSSNSFSVTSTTPILEYDNGRLRIYDAPGNYDQTVYIPTSEYIAGDNISINSNIISATYTAGDNIEITNGVISATSNVYTAGDNITIDDLGEISAVYPTYIAGDNITIDDYTISASYPVYTAGNGINIDDNGVISTTGSAYTLPVATSTVLGGIKLGYNGQHLPVELDEDSRAYVEAHVTLAGLITSGLSAHYFGVNHFTSGLIHVTDGQYIPLIQSIGINLGKIQIIFEVIGREDSGTYYAKYLLSDRTGGVNPKLICLDYWSDNSAFTYEDIVLVNRGGSPDQYPNGTFTLEVYKRYNYRASNPIDFFIVNVVAENASNYSTQHYYYARNSSIAEPGYQLQTGDSRIAPAGTTIDGIAVVNAENGTYHNEQTINIYQGNTLKGTIDLSPDGNNNDIHLDADGGGSTSTFTPVIDEIYITSGVATSQTGTNNMQTTIGNLDQVGYDCIEQEKDFKIFANFTDATTANNDLLYAFNLVNNIQTLLTNNLKAHHKIELYINTPTVDLASITFSRLVIPQKTKMIGQVGSDIDNCFNVDYDNSTVEFNLTKGGSAKIEFNYINTSNWFIWAYFLKPANTIPSS